MRKMTEYSESHTRVLVDGIKLLFDEDWVLLTPDSERALCHLLVESDTKERSEALLRKHEKLLTSWLAG